jgi:hypothetical protein
LESIDTNSSPIVCKRREFKHHRYCPLSVPKTNSTIMVVKATDDRLRCDAAYVLAGTMDWSVFAKRPMSPQLVIVRSILRQDPA